MRTAVIRTSQPVAVEAALATTVAAAVAALIVWLGPPGSDLAAHVYQSSVFDERGFTLWNNFWYSGRYSFVTYSVLYYPLAALLGIHLLAIASVATAALAFTVVVARQWGPAAKWSNRSFAVVWAGIVLSGAFPFALGAALALLALLALQSGARARFAVLAALTIAASPVAFVLLAVLLLGTAVSRRPEMRLAVPVATVALIGLAEVMLWRLFPSDGRFPFSGEELAAAVIFCLIGVVLTWRVPPAHELRWIFVVYLAACITVYLVPSEVGENIARLRFAAIPICILALSLRHWRPLVPCLVAFGLAISWNVTPLAASYAKGRSDPAADSAYWAPTIAFLQSHLTPDYRVEAVDTAGHWPAEYLPSAGIPIVRGWFRQDDFPHNGLLYERLDASTYVGWLRSLGVRYVVLPDAALDYSARHEAALLRSGRSGLGVAFRSPHTTVFEVPSPTPLITGPGVARVTLLEHARLAVDVRAPGRYRIAASWSPYWQTNRGCLTRSPDGMVWLTVKRATAVTLTVDVSARAALATLEGKHPRRCAG